MNVLEQWLENKIYHKENSDYLIKELHLKSIAIYGAGKMGELIYDDLLESDLDIKYFIDKNADSLYYGIDDMPIYNLEESKKAEKVGAIIVTPIKFYDEIKINLQRLLDYSPLIISLDEVIARTE